MIRRLAARNEWKFFSVLPKADSPLAFAWWLALLLRGSLPALFTIAMGVLVGAVQRGDSLASSLTTVGAVFVLLQILVADSSGDRREPRQPHGRVAL